jgi:hypothetical protein
VHSAREIIPNRRSGDMQARLVYRGGINSYSYPYAVGEENEV